MIFLADYATLTPIGFLDVEEPELSKRLDYLVRKLMAHKTYSHTEVRDLPGGNFAIITFSKWDPTGKSHYYEWENHEM